MNTDAPKIMMYEETDPVENAKARESRDRFERNWDWLEENATEVYSHRGKYLCIAGQELFVGDEVEDVIARAKAAHPEDTGLFTRYIPKERLPRIYAF